MSGLTTWYTMPWTYDHPLRRVRQSISECNGLARERGSSFIFRRIAELFLDYCFSIQHITHVRLNIWFTPSFSQLVLRSLCEDLYSVQVCLYSDHSVHKELCVHMIVICVLDSGERRSHSVPFSLLLTICSGRFIMSHRVTCPCVGRWPPMDVSQRRGGLFDRMSLPSPLMKHTCWVQHITGMYFPQYKHSSFRAGYNMGLEENIYSFQVDKSFCHRRILFARGPSCELMPRLTCSCLCHLLIRTEY